MKTKRKPAGRFKCIFAIDLTPGQLMEIEKHWDLDKDAGGAIIGQPHWYPGTSAGAYVLFGVMCPRLADQVERVLRKAQRA